MSTKKEIRTIKDDENCRKGKPANTVSGLRNGAKVVLHGIDERTGEPAFLTHPAYGEQKDIPFAELITKSNEQRDTAHE